MYDKIFKLIQNGELNKAQEQLENTPENDPKRYNISGLIYYQKKEFDKAKEEFEKGLKINPVDSDLLFNYGYLLKNINQEKEAWRYLMRIHNKDWATYDLLGDIEYKNRSKLASLRFYKKAAELPNSPNEMKKKFIDMRNIVKQDTKIAFLCLPGLDNFLKDIVETFSLGYDVKLVVTTDGNQISEAIKWADIVWLEWANEMTVFATNQVPEIQNKKVVCRLHSYEIFTQFPDKINWTNIDQLIFVGDHIKRILHELHPNLNINPDKEIIVYNGVDLDKFKFLVHKPGYNLSVLAHINYKKDPSAWIQIINKLKEIDNRYKLHVGGDFQDPRYKIYFDYIKKEMKLENNFILHGWINEVDKFLEDKDYTLSTSIHESFGYNIAEAMARGIKPIIHNFDGAKSLWPNELIYNTIDEAVEKITEQTYDSESYRRFIEDNYSLEKQIYEIDQFFFNFSKMNKNVHLTQKNSKKSLLTLGVTNYNSERYINDFLDSVVNQTYKNIELIIVDDCSTDKSPEIIMQYAKKFDFIRLIVHESNKGSPDYGRAEILNLAKGDYLIFFDSDDKFTYPHSLEKMINYIQMNDEIDYVYTDYNIIDENGRNINRWQYKYLTSEEIIVSVFNRKGSGVLPMKGIFKTDFFRKNNINYPINGTSADTLLSLICLKNNMKYDYLNGDLVSYRIHSSNFTINKQKRLDSLIPIIDYLIENFKDIIFTNKSEEEISINLFNYFKNFFYLYELELWKPWGIDYDNFEYININYFKLIEILKKYSSLYDKHKNKYLFLADYIENLYTKKHKPLVSILIPTYNLIDFFKEAFQSALSQTYPNIEIIVSDDSTNSSIEDYMKDFLATYSGDKIVKFFKHENKNGDLGKSNHEFLLNIASGEFISFLHHDDLIHTEKIRLMMHFFILEDNVSLVTSYRKLIDENGNFLNDSVATKRISNNLIIANGLEISRLLFKAGVNFIGEPSTAIFKYQNNKSLSSYKGYEIRALGDYAQWLNSLEKNNFVYIPVALNYTRRHKSQNTHKMVVKSQCLENYFYLLKAFYSDKKELENEYKQFLLRQYKGLLNDKIDINLKMPIIYIFEEELDRLFAHKCIICGNYFDKFKPYNNPSSDFVKNLEIIGSDVNHFSCPYCGSMDRERHLILFIEKLKIGQMLFENKDILHFAPEPYFKEYIRRHNPRKHILADLYPKSNDIYKIDDLDISFPSESFDTVIFNHVLEHVENPEKAMSEIHRVLRKGGYVILQTPYSEKLEKTFYSDKIKTDEEKLQYYGQADHLRIFGKDLFELISAYFDLKLIKSSNIFDDQIAYKYGFNNKEPLFLCKKN